jgi:hypothetical protein
MGEAFNAGDRVHVRVENRFHGYRPGDRGTVPRAAPLASTGARYYLVAMDKDGPEDTGVLFDAHEIEPDV